MKRGVIMLNIKINDIAKSINKVDITEIEEVDKNHIAIIGISGKFPMAHGIDELWDNLQNARECVSELPMVRKNEANKYLAFKNKNVAAVTYKKGGYLDKIDDFDCRFFNISPKEASLMDPNQKLFLETSWSAIEDSGYGGDKLKGSRTGVYFGFVSDMAYQRFIADIEPASVGMSIPGNLASVIPGLFARFEGSKHYD
jgi:acyl transferase domain-containing protein